MGFTLATLRHYRDRAKALRSEADELGDREVFMRASKRWTWAIERIARRTLPGVTIQRAA